MDDEGRRGKVQVIDRRSFTADGDPKDEKDLPQPPPQSATQATEAAAAADTDGMPPPDSLHGKPGFLDLVDFFAQQAVLLLSGKAPGHGQDPEAARYFIDLLAVVEEKTRGRLSTEENRYVEDVLFQLRSLFVASVR